MIRIATLLALTFSLFIALPTSAQESRPWAAGVAPDQQEKALAIFREGNTLFTDSKYSAALAKYREALAIWNHPAIHYNAAVSLINLDQPLNAYEHVEAALAFGDAPLGAENHQQALLYKKLLAGQLSELEVSCEEPGAEVMLDGKLLFIAPGQAKRRLMPGAHQLAARKAGLLTDSRALELPSGKLTRETLKLGRITATPMRSVRRWDEWKPWAVLGGGAAVALLGIPLMLDASSNFDTFDAEITRLCPAGCSPNELPQTVLSTRDRGRTENTIAVGMFIGGGAIAATGVALLVMNQARLVPVEPGRNKPVAVTPMIAPGAGGVATSMRF